MSQKGLEVQKNYPLRKKVSEFFWGGWCMQTNWNYERQMNTAFMWGISKTIDRLYPEPEELEKKKTSIVILDAPTLIENDLHKEMDSLISLHKWDHLY